MLLLNCGGTFNKRYNPIDGVLEVPYDNYAIEQILMKSDAAYQVAGAIYKDSLEMDSEDRKSIANIIAHSSEEAFLIVHGTDTMEKTAEFLAQIFDNKKIVLTGAMKPFEIDPIESTFNLGLACGFLTSLEKSGVYICMSGHIALWNKISKNRSLGKFQLVK